MLARVLRGNQKLALSVTAPSVERIPLDLVFVIDKSGSTESDATPGLDESERDGISILDLIKHLVKVAIESLGESDRVAVVQFDERASVKYPMSFMSSGNKRTASARLESIISSGGTQIWSGIHLGLETMRTAAHVDGARTRSVLVFTDGLDVKKPLRGNMHELMSWIGANESDAISMHTIGFGNALDSRELFEMAGALGGTFSHIPDASTAGTILINRCAADLTTFATRMRLGVTKADGTQTHADLGSIRVGQTRVWPINDATRIELSFFNGSETETIRVAPVDGEPSSEAAVEASAVKADLTDTLKHVIETCESSNRVWALPYCAQQLAQFQARAESKETVSPYIKACVADVRDQLHKAVENEKWHTAWGMHYLRSYLHATAHEIANNFRDHAVQHYVTPAFTAVQAQCESIFLAAPPIPKKPPRARGEGAQGASGAAQAAPRAPTTTYQDRYYDRSGGCFSPDAKIKMFDGSVKEIGALAKGDVVACSEGRSASVRCLVWSSGTFELACIDGFRLTPTHPVRNASAAREWVHPKDLTLERSESARVVNLVLDETHEVVSASGLVCCTLAHGLREPVVEHEYLGTEAVLRDLQKLDGFAAGSVEATFVRGPEYIAGLR
jgi:hypothetical protein